MDTPLIFTSRRDFLVLSMQIAACYYPVLAILRVTNNLQRGSAGPRFNTYFLLHAHWPLFILKINSPCFLSICWPTHFIAPITIWLSRDRAVNTLGSIWIILGLCTYVLNNKMAQITQKYFVLLTGHSPHYPEPPTFRALIIWPHLPCCIHKFTFSSNICFPFAM